MPQTLPPPELFVDTLTEDMEDLLGRFQQSDSIRFQDFSSVWRQMSFSDIFIGLDSVSVAKRFCTVAMATALKYFLPPYSFQIRVGGLYLMYGLYNLQPTSPPVPVRLPLKDFATVEKFMEDSDEAGHYDVVYIYRKMLSERVFAFTAMPELLDYSRVKKPKNPSRAFSQELMGRTTAVQELSECLEELNNVQTHYETMKKKVAEVSPRATVTLPDFAEQLHGCMSDFVNWQIKTFTKGVKTEAVEDPSSTRAQLLSSIKQKSYSACPEALRSRRHRQVEQADSSSGSEQVTKPKKQRNIVPSLMSRTRRVLDVEPDLQPKRKWLLCVPDEEVQKNRPVRKDWRVKKKLHELT